MCLQGYYLKLSVNLNQLAESTRWTKSKSPLQRMFLKRFREPQNHQQLALRTLRVWLIC